MLEPEWIELETVVEAANGPALATPEYAALKRALADEEEAEAEVERRRDARRAAYTAWSETPEYQAFRAAVTARSAWQSANWPSWRAVMGMWQDPQEREEAS